MPRGDRSTTTRAALLKAGARVFVRRSLQGATVREIVEEAGLTIPVLYYHFSGKEELYAEVVRDGREQFRAMLAAALAERHDAIERLRRIALVYVRFGRDDPVRLRLLCGEIFRAPGCGELEADAGELAAWTRGQIAAVLQQARAERALPIPVPAVAERVFLALLVGVLIEQARDPDAPVLDDDVADQLVQTFCAGIGALTRGGNGRAPSPRTLTRPRVDRRAAPLRRETK